MNRSINEQNEKIDFKSIQEYKFKIIMFPKIKKEAKRVIETQELKKENIELVLDKLLELSELDQAQEMFENLLDYYRSIFPEDAIDYKRLREIINHERLILK